VDTFAVDDKSGKIKFTFEMDINPPMMQLIKEDVDMMTDLMAQGIAEARKQMRQRGQKGPMAWGQGGGHGGGGMGYMHHGMGMESKE
jgi:DNA-binding protein YbaB